MRFNAIVFRPFKGEVFDAVVTQVNKLGFFAQVGPLQVFVSKHLIPSDMKFDPQATPAAYVSEISDEQPQRVTKDSEVRARCMHTHAHVDVWGDVTPPSSPRLPCAGPLTRRGDSYRCFGDLCNRYHQGGVPWARRLLRSLLAPTGRGVWSRCCARSLSGSSAAAIHTHARQHEQKNIIKISSAAAAAHMLRALNRAAPRLEAAARSLAMEGGLRAARGARACALPHLVALLWGGHTHRVRPAGREPARAP